MKRQKENVILSKPISINSMTEAEFDAELEKGYRDIINGDVISAKCAFKEIREKYNL